MRQQIRPHVSRCLQDMHVWGAKSALARGTTTRTIHEHVCAGDSPRECERGGVVGNGAGRTTAAGLCGEEEERLPVWEEAGGL